jgi:hypothetical protein
VVFTTIKTVKGVGGVTAVEGKIDGCVQWRWLRRRARHLSASVSGLAPHSASIAAVSGRAPRGGNTRNKPKKGKSKSVSVQPRASIAR